MCGSFMLCPPRVCLSVVVSDDEKEKDKENGEENNGETENNNDTKSAAPAKSKG